MSYIQFTSVRVSLQVFHYIQHVLNTVHLQFIPLACSEMISMTEETLLILQKNSKQKNHHHCNQVIINILLAQVNLELTCGLSKQQFHCNSSTKYTVCFPLPRQGSLETYRVPFQGKTFFLNTTYNQYQFLSQHQLIYL